MTYLTILRFEFPRIQPKTKWSIYTLKHFFSIRVFAAQSELKKTCYPLKMAA